MIVAPLAMLGYFIIIALMWQTSPILGIFVIIATLAAGAFIALASGGEKHNGY